jgi:hypothetical protein
MRRRQHEPSRDRASLARERSKCARGAGWRRAYREAGRFEMGVVGAGRGRTMEACFWGAPRGWVRAGRRWGRGVLAPPQSTVRRLVSVTLVALGGEPKVSLAASDCLARSSTSPGRLPSKCRFPYGALCGSATFASSLRIRLRVCARRRRRASSRSKIHGRGAPRVSSIPMSHVGSVLIFSGGVGW